MDFHTKVLRLWIFNIFLCKRKAWKSIWKIYHPTTILIHSSFFSFPVVCVCMCVGLNACVSMCQYNHNIKIHKHLLIPSYFSQLYQSGNDGIKIGFIISQISHLTHQMMIYIFLYIINHISFKASNPKKVVSYLTFYLFCSNSHIIHIFTLKNSYPTSMIIT